MKQFAIDDDLEVIDNELLELEETLDLSNLHFLQNVTISAIEHDENDDLVDFANWLIEFDKKDDYNLTELVKMFLK